MKKSIWKPIFSAIFYFIVASPVYAISTPTFPSCVSPQGSIKVSYSSGTHGIVGSGETYTGTDAVYTLTQDTLTQCFCSSTGEGIQTNWWKASSLSESDIAVLKTLGWIYVPAGQLWGLEAAPYVAINTKYACLPGSSSNTTSGDRSRVTGDGTGGGEVLGVETGDVLGLAATGDLYIVYLSFVLGIGLTYLGLKRLRGQG
jgi:hypothetical protein